MGARRPRLGQHFLHDPSILSRIADAARIEPGEAVLEIGPGRGSLTRELAARAASVTAIEADPRLAHELEQRFEGTSVRILRGDALQVPWPRVARVCGNIPYQITSPLIEKALTPPRPRCIVFMVQREVALRLAAPAGSKTYGALSAGVQLVAEVERLFSVPAGAFRPRPRVESAVVRITPRIVPLVRDAAEEAATRRLIRAAFQRRRQQLQRTLREAFNLQPSTAAGVLRAAGFNPTIRPEQLTPSEFVVLARSLPPV